MSAPAAAGAACVHDWQPIMGWYARYRCAICRVIGYKPGAVHTQHARSMAITPYRCEVRCGGKRCAGPAVHSWRGKKLRCAVHVHSGRTAKARDTLAAQVRTAHEEVPPASQEVASAAHQVLNAHREVPTAPQQVSSAGHAVSCERHDVVTKEDA